jgi:hypothetical protein
MSLLSRLRFAMGRQQTEADGLRKEVSALRAALIQRQTMVRNWTSIRVWLVAAVAASLILGFVLGVYREPITLTITECLPGLLRPDPITACRNAHEEARYAAALQLARPLAEQGDARAQFLLGLMYAKGQGVPQDPGEAAKWYRLAADRGDAHAQYELAWLYASGDGVAQDDVAAHMWFNLASASLPASDPRRRVAAGNRHAVEGRMTREQIAEARQRARDWIPK